MTRSFGETSKLMQQATSWVVGPGIGRGTFIQTHFMKILQQMDDRLVVIDADGLWLLQHL